MKEAEENEQFSYIPVQDTSDDADEIPVQWTAKV